VERAAQEAAANISDSKTDAKEGEGMRSAASSVAGSAVGAAVAAAREDASGAAAPSTSTASAARESASATLAARTTAEAGTAATVVVATSSSTAGGDAAATTTSSSGPKQPQQISSSAPAAANSAEKVSPKEVVAAAASTGRTSDASSPVPPTSATTPSSSGQPGSKQTAITATGAARTVPAGAGAAPAAAIAAAAAAAAVDDTIRAQRAVLVNTYAPHIQGTDTSLEAARTRLLGALDQTRYLRAMYTDRVYDRYRINLLPVPDAVDDIVGRIMADPGGAARILREESRSVKEEKEMEKREGAVRLSPVAVSVEPGRIMADTAGSSETAEQLAWYGAGLNTVILPEQEVDDALVQRYEFRGPTDLQTGQRVAGISAACATAAEGLLDRVRRASVLRSERKRRRESAAGVGGTTAPFAGSSRETHNLFSSTVAGIVGASGKGKKRAKASTISGIQGAGRGGGRTKSQASSATLLSLDPGAETVGRAKPTAAAAALASAGVGDNTWIRGTPRHSLQMKRWMHPFPDSKAGKKITAVASAIQSGKKTAGVAASVSSLFADPKVIMAPLDAKSRKAMKNVSKVRRSAAAKPSVVTGACSVLDRFCDAVESAGTVQGSIAIHNDIDGETPHSLTAVDFLFRMRPSSMDEKGCVSSSSPIDGISSDPVTTLSVLHALGLFTTNTPKESRGKRGTPPAHLKGKRKFTETFSAFAEEAVKKGTEKKPPPVEHIRGGGSSDHSDGNSDDKETKTKTKEDDSSKANGDSNGKAGSPPEQVSENENDTKPGSSPPVKESSGAADGKASLQSTAASTSAQPGLSPSLLPSLAGNTIPPFTQQAILQMQQHQAQGGLGVGAGFVSSLLSPAMSRASAEGAYSNSLQAAAAARSGVQQDVSDYLGSSFHAQRVAAGYALPSDWASVSLASANAGLSQQALASLSAHD